MNSVVTKILKKKSAQFLFLFHCIFFISYRKIFLICRECIIGHNWDWGFPALDFHLRRLYEIPLFTWFEFNLGSGLFLNISQLFPNAIVSALAHILSPKYVIILILYLVHFFAFVFFKRLLDQLIEKKNYNYVPSLLYAFSPFLFNEIIGGSWYMWISFAVIPLFFSSLYAFVKKGETKEIVLFVLASIFAIPSLQNTVLIEAIIFCVFCYELFVSQQRFVLIKRYILAHLILFFLNLYFILPFLTSLLALLTYTSQAEFTGNFNSFLSLTQNIIGILSLTGYLDRNMYQFLFGSWMLKIWYSVVIVSWVWFLHILKSNKVKRPLFYVFFFIFLGSILIVKGGLPPFSKVTLLMFRHIPLFSLYRSPQHLMLAPAFLIPLLFTYVISVSRSLPKSVVLGVVLIWISGWWLNGDLGKVTLFEQKKDRVDTYRLSPSVERAFVFNERSESDYRTVFLPTVVSPEYLKTEYQNKAQGGQPEYILLNSPTFSSERSHFAEYIDDFFCFKQQKDPKDLVRYLSILNVKYLVLRDDIEPKFTRCAEEGSWNNTIVRERLDQMKNQGLVEEEGDSGIFLLKDQFVLPKIYVAHSVLYTDGKVSDLPKLVTTPDYHLKTAFIFNDAYKEKKQLFEYDPALAEVEYQPINSTQYDLTISNATSPFLLVFSDNFDSYWRLTEPNQEGLKYFFPASLIDQIDHIQVNGYANGWVIDPEVFCSNNESVCELDENGARIIHIQLEFVPQKLLYLGAIFSIVAACLFLLWVFWRRKGVLL